MCPSRVIWPPQEATTSESPQGTANGRTDHQEPKPRSRCLRHARSWDTYARFLENVQCGPSTKMPRMPVHTYVPTWWHETREACARSGHPETQTCPSRCRKDLCHIRRSILSEPLWAQVAKTEGPMLRNQDAPPGSLEYVRVRH